MDKYTIFDQAGPATAVAPARDDESVCVAALRDLDAALQLLAERAQYLTGACGASIAVLEDREMVCHASSGRAVPEVGAEIETNSGLAAESIRTRQFVRCDDADTDPRVNRQSCQELGVKSIMVMPLLREHDVAGVFELVADRPSAFEKQDGATLMRLAEMALTALEHADAAQRALPEISEPQADESSSEQGTIAPEPAKPAPMGEELLQNAAQPPAPEPATFARIGSCEACGFPVSQGRTLCVDCEQAGRSSEGKPALSHLNGMEPEESWFQAHSYTLGALFIAALTIALLALKLR